MPSYDENGLQVIYTHAGVPQLLPTSYDMCIILLFIAHSRSMCFLFEFAEHGSIREFPRENTNMKIEACVYTITKNICL